MIVHVFTANRYHLVPGISKNIFLNWPNLNHKYILYGNNQLNEDLYKKEYSKFNFSNYEFCHNLKEFRLILGKYRNEAILFHAGEYSWFLLAILLGCKKINWVCWGAGASIGKSFKSHLMTPIKKFIYNKFQNIITLMDEDKETTSQDFKVPSQRIHVIPYSGNKIDIYGPLCDKFRNEKCETNDKPMVLLGNNSSNIENYIELLPILEKYKGRIRVQCMLNYSLDKNDKYYYLNEFGHEIFGDDFSLDEEFRDLNHYLEHMNLCDIYICSATNQTGLGAIYNCLRLGKKIYITGKNYSWITNYYQAKVFNSDVLNDDNYKYSEFSRDLTNEEKEYNNNCVVSMREENYKNWEKFLLDLNN